MARGVGGKKVPASLARGRLAKYQAQAAHYRRNALDLWARGDDGKAGEAAWGAVASALKGLSLARASRLLRAGEVRAYGARTARELRLPEEFAAVEILHANFYDPFLGRDAFQMQLDRALRFLEAVLAEVDRLVPPQEGAPPFP